MLKEKKVKEFTPKQLQQISELNVEISYSTGGKNQNLHWDINKEGVINAYLFYNARDCDGDWGSASTYHSNISFKELLETIKNPTKYFNTRSWN